MPETERKKLLFVIFGLVGAILIALALVFIPKPAPAAPTPVPGTPFAPRVTLADAKKAYDAGTAIFIDVRSGETFKVRHIQGAFSIPEAELAAHLQEFQKDAWLIPY